MKINSKKVLKDLKGEKDLSNDKEPLTLGEAMGNILIMDRKGGKMKTFLLAQKFATSKEVELDQADLSFVKQATETSEAYSNLITGQILVILDGLKEKTK